MSGGKLTTHVLDLAHGCPAAAIAIHLQRLPASGADTPETLCTRITNADGRVDKPLLSGAEMKAGRYQLIFFAADYFRSLSTDLPDVPFLDDVVIRFGISDAQAHYHVPLLLSPYGYSTYRGS